MNITRTALGWAVVESTTSLIWRTLPTREQAEKWRAEVSR